MLVLTRRIGEEIVIGENIRIVVQRLGSNRVKLGIDAPPTVHIVRGELERMVHPVGASRAQLPIHVGACI